MIIKKFEEAIMMPTTDLEKTDINPTLFWAYINSREAENELIDFNEVIWGDQIAPISRQLEAEGVHEFTISSTYSGLVEILEAFEEQGWKIAGTTKVNARYTEWKTGKHAIIPAIKMTKEEK